MLLPTCTRRRINRTAWEKAPRRRHLCGVEPQTTSCELTNIIKGGHRLASVIEKCTLNGHLGQVRTPARQGLMAGVIKRHIYQPSLYFPTK